MAWFKERKVKLGRHQGWIVLMLDGVTSGTAQAEIDYYQRGKLQFYTLLKTLVLAVHSNAYRAVEAEFWIKDEDGNEILLGSKPVANNALMGDIIVLNPSQHP